MVVILDNFRDDFLLERSGPAAVEYLRFQRHVIAFTALLCIISVGIILPVNFRGDLQSLMTSSFPKTTINNVDVKWAFHYFQSRFEAIFLIYSRGDLLWVHVAFTMILFPMALLVMLSYGLKFGLTNKRRKVRVYWNCCVPHLSAWTGSPGFLPTRWPANFRLHICSSSISFR